MFHSTIWHRVQPATTNARHAHSGHGRSLEDAPPGPWALRCALNRAGRAARSVRQVVVAVMFSVMVGAIACALAASADATTWGINLDGFPIGGTTFPYQGNPYFTDLLTSYSYGDGHHGLIGSARIFVPWDAFSGKDCASTSGPAGADFIYKLSAAHQLGLDPLVAISTGAYYSGYGNYSGYSRDEVWPTDGDYTCAFEALWNAAKGFGLQVSQWEVFNEPDSPVTIGGTQYYFANGTSYGGNGNGHGGSAQGAAYWYQDAYLAELALNFNTHDTLVAGSFNEASSGAGCCGYIDSYMNTLVNKVGAFLDNTDVALHPYESIDDAPKNSGNPGGGLATAIGAINRYANGSFPIWLTEAGVELTDVATDSYSAGCSDNTVSDNGKLAACVDDSPPNQAVATEGYLNLPAVSSQVQRVYYYDFASGSPYWDSALMNMSGGGNGVPRTSWCALYYYADGNSPAASAWDSAANPYCNGASVAKDYADSGG